jgi:hypothetical protein
MGSFAIVLGFPLVGRLAQGWYPPTSALTPHSAPLSADK